MIRMGRLLAPSGPLNFTTGCASVRFKKFVPKMTVSIQDFATPDIPLPKDGEKYQPAKLHMVWQIKTLFKRPKWEKYIMKSMGLEKVSDKYVIVKNTPQMNHMLWKVKHLIRIKPITFPNGLPEDDDITGTLLKQNGEFVISRKLRIDPQKILEEPVDAITNMDPDTLKKHLRKRWVDCFDT